MIWVLLLHINAKLKELESPCRFIAVNIKPDSYDLHFDSHFIDSSLIIDFEGMNDQAQTHILVKGPFSLEIKKNTLYSHQDIQLLVGYLPYALLPHFSMKMGKCFAITHFAQTLDGKIASASGNSEWIGNDENRIHAHKMRALCDGIMVGAGTLKSDNPELNVRMVKGKNPIKIVVGGDKLNLQNYKAVDQNTIILCEKQTKYGSKDHPFSLNTSNGIYRPGDLLKFLYHKGLHSVYIEGGSYTTSVFLKYRVIDQVQVHITPKILGSGISGFQFDGLNHVQDAIEFCSYRFVPIGSHMMFVGELNSKYK